MAGKTGTAQTGYIAQKGDDAKRAAYYTRDHAWFAAFAPAKAPEIAVVVFIEHGGSGPTQAAPIAIQIIRDYQRLAAARGPHVKPPPPPKFVWPSNMQATATARVTQPQADDAGDDASIVVMDPDGAAP
jgi:Penicillin binding protein transpeptidase domain